MAKTSNISAAAKQFVKEWTGKGYEKGETQRYWLSLLHNVFGVDDPTRLMEFEIPVKTITKEKGSDFIDAYITSTKVLIEQKGSHVDLSAKARQSDGSELTPYQQGRRYAAGLPLNMHPRWIVACNFTTFEIHDMEHPNDAPQVVRLEDLEKEYYRLSFLVDDTIIHTKKEVEVSMAAGAIIGDIFDAFRKEYRNPDDPHSQRSLNILCVRLVFCLYAEDAGLFDTHSQFHDYLVQFKPGTGDMRKALIDLFDVLSTPVEERDPYLRDDLLAFPYVNGGLFAEKGIEIPRFTQEIADLLLRHASDDFDWSQISPTIFGGVFESTLNPETRRKGGMHYTSIENIHKVIDPLFLDELKQDLADIKAEPSEKKRIQKAQEFQDQLAGLKFLDPACGSGNFLTETFLSLRRLENEAIRIIHKGQMMMGEFVNPIKVSINQFYGIEINDFACSVAQTALWIAEAQMLFETEKIMQLNLDFLPLKSYTNIHEGNALRMDWNEVVPANELNYIMGNPPFVGARMMEQGGEQKLEIKAIFGDIKDVQDLDYVCGWYRKAADYMAGTDIHAGFVSTNSICQGAQVPLLWGTIIPMGISIDFAHTSFKWENEASGEAAVNCIIVGFSYVGPNHKLLYRGGNVKRVSNISPYLTEGDNIFVTARKEPICDVPKMCFGNQPRDGGYFVVSAEERTALIKSSPEIARWIRPYIGADELIRGKSRYCFWLKGITPSELRSNSVLMDVVSKVRDFRLSSSAKTTNGYAKVPHLFAQITQPEGNAFMLLPKVSTDKRNYIPIGFYPKDTIASDLVLVMPDATLYLFGILTSAVHMGWMRMVCGRLGNGYRYSKEIVYNNYPWPVPSDVQKAKIEATAQAILDARALYPDSSLADLYDDLTMPVELRKAHRANDAAVMEAYGFRKDMTEPEIVAELFKMYQKLTNPGVNLDNDEIDAPPIAQ